MTPHQPYLEQQAPKGLPRQVMFSIAPHVASREIVTSLGVDEGECVEVVDWVVVRVGVEDSAEEDNSTVTLVGD